MKLCDRAFERRLTAHLNFDRVNEACKHKSAVTDEAARHAEVLRIRY